VSQWDNLRGGYPVEVKPDQPFVSVVVSFHNDAAFLRNCLLSLLNQTYPRELYEVILINDGSIDGSQETISDLLTAHRPTVKLFTQPDKGPSAGRNLGVSNARGSIVAFTDPDCVVDHAWVAQHAEGYVSEEVGGIEGHIETDWDRILYPIRVSPAGYRYVTANISYRHDVLERVGFFDESFRFKEDDELAYRVIEAGWTIRTEDRAVVYHPVRSMTLRGLVSLGLKHRYDVLFYKKHPDLGRSYFRIIKAGPLAITPEFFISCAGVLAIVLLGTAFLSNVVLGLLLLAAFATLAVFQRHRMMRRRTKASILWMAAFAALIEAGRIWGSLKFRQVLL
jgi:glycosyltransferase involved in cell wall biosynthesis